ncbi:hypothetical protein HNQ92_001238 [Rhabdobacter roseus]|uniref:Uncharacterized protein n=1 Tax=Rhabdobacter roseus TaxID=1655419 RepID=A0A840TNI4_9BACT|nr:hypothetical protein [Rhabdobacter roseus]
MITVTKTLRMSNAKSDYYNYTIKLWRWVIFQMYRY